jgi:hypothetical protein
MKSYLMIKEHFWIVYFFFLPFNPVIMAAIRNAIAKKVGSTILEVIMLVIVR